MRRRYSRLRVSLVAIATGMSILGHGALAQAKPTASPTPSVTDDNRFNDAVRQGNEFLQAGEIHGDVQSLTRAADIFRHQVLPLAPRDSRMADWAETQAKLGRAHLCIGALTANLSHYENAVSAYRSVLEVKSRDDAPNEWANAQNNLGGALLGIGKLTAQLPRLREAEGAFRQALEIYTIEGSPKKWAEALTNMGITHFLMGDLTSDATYYSTALEELASAQPLLAKPAANSVGTIIGKIEQRLPKS